MFFDPKWILKISKVHYGMLSLLTGNKDYRNKLLVSINVYRKQGKNKLNKQNVFDRSERGKHTAITSRKRKMTYENYSH